MKTAIVIFALICLSGVLARTTSGCAPKTYEYKTYQCRSCIQTNCNECTGPAATECTTCAANTAKWIEGIDTCLPVLSQCKGICINQGTFLCNGCAEGFYNVQNANQTAIAICKNCGEIANCARCSDSKTCTACVAGYFLNEAKVCTPCGTGCAQCTDAITCNTCRSTFVKDSSSKCVACGNGCAECDATTPSKCNVCSATFFLNAADNTCYPLANCEEAADKKCTTCMDGFRLRTDGTCTACTNNAQLCNSVTDAEQSIISCNPNTIKTIAGTTNTKVLCLVLPADNQKCIQMDSDGVCRQCDTDNVLSAGKCVTCTSLNAGCSACAAGATNDAVATCNACKEGWYNSAQTGAATCVACPANCKSCDNTGKCTACDDDAYNANASVTASTTLDCRDCSSNALACTDANTATTCKNNFVLLTVGVCRNCSPELNCKDCVEFNKCTVCAQASPTMSVDTTGKCVVCDANCSSGCAVKGQGLCDTACKVGWRFHKTEFKCYNECKVPNCGTCVANIANECQTCNNGYTVHTTTNQCSACSANCKTCAFATIGECTAANCYNGYGLGWDNEAVPAVLKVCTHKCAFSNAGLITCVTKSKPNTAADAHAEIDGNQATCAARYIKEDTKPNNILCVPCPANCSECAYANNKAECAATKCDDGYFLNGATKLCLQGTLGGKQITDSAGTVEGAHTNCISGYSLVANQGPNGDLNRCLKCDVNCNDCTTRGTGKCNDGQCKPGFYLETTGNTCQPCNATCATCSASNTCDTCKDNTVWKPSTWTAQAKELCKAKNIPDCLTFAQVDGADSADKCATCKDGFYLGVDGKTCERCDSNCKCSASTEKCTSCISAKFFYHTTDKKCNACTVANCLDCAAAVGTCTTCDEGYIRNTEGSQCEACATHCKTCVEKDKCSNDGCKVGYGDAAATVPQTICVACPSSCKTCTVDALTEVTTCQTCIAGYYLNAQKNCVNTNCGISVGYGAIADGISCTRCPYGTLFKAGSGCVDCIADASCPQACVTVAPPGGPGTGGPGTGGTDSGFKLAFNLFVLAFVAILGHMMI